MSKYHIYPEEYKGIIAERMLKMSEYVCAVCGETIRGMVFYHPTKDNGWELCYFCYQEAIEQAYDDYSIESRIGGDR